MGFETGSDNERIAELERQFDIILDSQINSIGGNESLSIDSTLGARNAASGDSGGVRSNEPIIHNITEDDESGTPTGTFDRISLISSMIIVDHTSSPMDLKFIQGPAKDGAKIKITVKKDKVLVIKSGGNILTSTDITITDTEFFTLVKHSEAETGIVGGAYKILLIGAGAIIVNPPFVDSNALIEGSGDPSKLMRFEIDGFATSVTRVMTLPDASVTLAGLGVVTQQWTGTNDFVGPVAVRDTNFFIENLADITKQLKFDLAGGTAGQVTTLDFNPTGNRTITFFDSSTTVAGLGVVSQTWTGTNIFAGLTDVIDENFSIQDFDNTTREARFSSGLISNSTIRTLSIPNSTTTLAGLGVTSQTWTGTNDFVGITTVIDSNFGIRDFSDNTKVASFDSSLISTSTTRTYSLPDSTTTLAGLGVVSQTWTGTNTYFGPTIMNGDVTIGSDSADSLFINAKFASSIIPEISTFDIGDSGANEQVRDIYLKSGFNNSKIFFDAGGDTYLTGSGTSGRINVFADAVNTIAFTTTAIFLTNGVDIAVGTGTGTRIATTTSQKIAFFGSTPIVQPATPAATSAAIITALQALGLVA